MYGVRDEAEDRLDDQEEHGWSVEGNMTELENDREDVQEEMEKECYEEEVQPYRKTDYKATINITITKYWQT